MSLIEELRKITGLVTEESLEERRQLERLSECPDCKNVKSGPKCECDKGKDDEGDDEEEEDENEDEDEEDDEEDDEEELPSKSKRKQESLSEELASLLSEKSAAAKKWETISVPEAKRLRDEAKKQGFKIKVKPDGSTIYVEVEEGSFSSVHDLAKSMFAAPKFKVKEPAMASSPRFEIELQAKALVAES